MIGCGVLRGKGGNKGERRTGTKVTRDKELTMRDAKLAVVTALVLILATLSGPAFAQTTAPQPTAPSESTPPASTTPATPPAPSLAPRDFHRHRPDCKHRDSTC
jgi:hypothetical protein